jgi:hypothetical protein
MALTALYESGAFGATGCALQGGDARPLVESILTPRITSESRLQSSTVGALSVRHATTKSTRGTRVSCGIDVGRTI